MAVHGTYFVGPSGSNPGFSFGGVASGIGMIGRYAANAALRKISRMVPDAGRQVLRAVTPNWIFDIGATIANKCGFQECVDFCKREEFRKKIGSLNYAALTKQGQGLVAELIPYHATTNPIEQVEELKSLGRTLSNEILDRYGNPVLVRDPSTWSNGRSNVFSWPLTAMNDRNLRQELTVRYQTLRGSLPLFDPVLLLQNHQHIEDQNARGIRPLVNLPEMEAAIVSMHPSKLPAGVNARQKFTAEQNDIALLYRYGRRQIANAKQFISDTVADIETEQQEFAKHSTQLMSISEKALAQVEEKATSSTWKSGHVFLDRGTYYVIEEREGNDLGEINELQIKNLLRDKSIRPGDTVSLVKDDTGVLRQASKFGKYIAYKIDSDTLAAVISPGTLNYAIGNKFSFRFDDQNKRRLTIGNENITRADTERTNAVLRTHSLLTMNSLVSEYVNGTIDQMPLKRYQQLVISLNQLKTEDNTLGNMLEFFAGEKNSKVQSGPSLKQLISQRVYLNDYAREVRDIAWNRSRVSNDAAAYRAVQEARGSFEGLHQVLATYPTKTGNMVFNRKTIIEGDIKKLLQQSQTIIQLMNQTILPSGPAAAVPVDAPLATAGALDAIKHQLNDFYRTAMKLQLALGNESISARLRDEDLRNVCRAPLFILGDLNQKIGECLDKVGKAYKSAAMNITEGGFASVMESLKHQRAAFAQAQVAAAEELTADYRKALS